MTAMVSVLTMKRRGIGSLSRLMAWPRKLVTNAEFAAFVADGGYEQAGVLALRGLGLGAEQPGFQQPFYWRRAQLMAGRNITLQGEVALQLQQPVSHISYFEVVCLCFMGRVRGCRPRPEWEAAVTVRCRALEQMFGAVWQWTSSAYAPYPGFRARLPARWASIMASSWSISMCCAGLRWLRLQGHSRATYRNFFPAGARWQFSGVRLAK